MKARVFTAIPLMVVILAIVFFNNPIPVVFTSFFAFLICQSESIGLFSRIRKNSGESSSIANRAWIVLLAAVILILAGIYMPTGFLEQHWRPFLTFGGILTSSSFLVLAIRYLRLASEHNPDSADGTYGKEFADYLVSINMGLSLIGLIIYHSFPETSGTWNFHNFLILGLVCVWAGDIAGIFVGKSFGKRKLSPQISPGKTWEGALGNFIFASLAGLILGSWCGVGILGGLLTGAIVGIVGQVGDLTESAIKRLAGVKDSGSILPGHGGLYDRVDSLIAASSFIWIPLVIFGHLSTQVMK